MHLRYRARVMKVLAIRHEWLLEEMRNNVSSRLNLKRELQWSHSVALRLNMMLQHFHIYAPKMG